MFNKRAIVGKTAEVGFWTMASRILGIAREALMMRYLGASALAAAFLTAYKIPNGLRKVFAEGAMSAAFVPTLAATVHDEGRSAANGLMALAFLVFEGLVLLLCVLGIVYANAIIAFIVPGFTPEKIAISAECLRVVMPFIFFISSSALFAGALQSVGHFFVPAFSPVLLNVIFIATILLCKWFDLSLHYLCWGILVGGVAQFVLHIIVYLYNSFGFGAISWRDVKQLKDVLIRFLLCLPSISVMELSLFVDTSFASYLKDSAIPLIYLANRFVGIPLGVFAVAFATVLLPHFSRVVRYAPKRLSFYILEGTKLVFWVSLPIAVLMWYFAENIFETLFLCDGKFTMEHVVEAAAILRAFLIGLFFFSLNKVILSVYYALKVAWVPALIASISALCNVLFNWLLIDYLQAVGLAFATTCADIIRTLLFLLILHYGYNYKLYIGRQMRFFVCYIIQVGVMWLPFWILYRIMGYGIDMYIPSSCAWFFMHSIGFWFWVGPLSLLFIASLWITRHWFYNPVYFLE